MFSIKLMLVIYLGTFRTVLIQTVLLVAMPSYSVVNVSVYIVI